MPYDVVIVGGGPAGLSVALALGRAQKRALLCDSGPRRNAAAVHMHNFVTRDGTPPNEFRRLAREQLAPYASVEVRDVAVQSISGKRGAFKVELGTGPAEARRIVLCTGMLDEPPALEGFRELWGHSIFQCPYCHGWEVKGTRWGYLAWSLEALNFPLLLRGWTSDVVVFTRGAFEVPSEIVERFRAASVRLETRPVARLEARSGSLEQLVLADGATVPCDALFTHPPQRQVELVRALGLALDADGYVQVDAMSRATSLPGIYAAGDLTGRAQAAILAAAAGMQAAAALNHELTAELAVAGLL